MLTDGRYEPDEIDPTRLEEEEKSSEDEGWEQVGENGESEEELGTDYVILSKSLR